MARTVRRIGPSEWQLLREVRLRALRDAPHAFGSTFEEEFVRQDAWWAASAKRLAWFVSLEGEATTGLVAGHPAEDDPECRAVISMWVADPYRGNGTSEALMAAVMQWARADGASRIALKLAEGNDRARRLYDSLGFVPTGAREPLRSNPAVSVIEMRLALP